MLDFPPAIDQRLANNGGTSADFERSRSPRPECAYFFLARTSGVTKEEASTLSLLRGSRFQSSFIFFFVFLSCADVIPLMSTKLSFTVTAGLFLPPGTRSPTEERSYVLDAHISFFIN